MRAAAPGRKDPREAARFLLRFALDKYSEKNMKFILFIDYNCLKIMKIIKLNFFIKMC